MELELRGLTFLNHTTRTFASFNIIIVPLAIIFATVARAKYIAPGRSIERCAQTWKKPNSVTLYSLNLTYIEK